MYQSTGVFSDSLKFHLMKEVILTTVDASDEIQLSIFFAKERVFRINKNVTNIQQFYCRVSMIVINLFSVSFYEILQQRLCETWKQSFFLQKTNVSDDIVALKMIFYVKNCSIFTVTADTFQDVCLPKIVYKLENQTAN